MGDFPSRFMRLAWVIAAFTFVQPALAQTAPDVQRMIIEEATASRVPPSLALAVARVESNFVPNAESPAGARGVMQLMPKTARDVFGVTENRLWNARLNIKLGIAYLAQLYDQYGQRWDLALSHYNGGTLEGGAGPYAIPHDFTRKYVADVLRWQRVYASEVFDRPLPRPGDPMFATARAATDRPWRVMAAGGAPTSRARAAGERADHPWRRGDPLDPLEFDDWAEAHQRGIADRRDRYVDRIVDD